MSANVLPPSERNPKAWAKALLPLIQELSPDYQLNKKIKGIRAECLRQHSSGLWLSHSTIRIHGRYHHCFALLLCKDISLTYLYSPLMAGGRFDHNFDIWRAYGEYATASGIPQTRPPSVQSSHGWLNGFEAIVQKCTTKAESELLPFYLQKLSKGRANLYRLFDYALGLLDRIEVTENTLAAAPVSTANGLSDFTQHFQLQSNDPATWHVSLIRYWNLLCVAQRQGQVQISDALRYRWQSINLKATDIADGTPRLLEIPDKVRNTCIVLNNFEHFIPIRSELSSVLDLLMKI